MPTPRDSEVLRMDGWPGGVNNRLRETEHQAASRNQFELPPSQWCRSAVNVDLTADGHPMRRVGYSLKTSGFAHSLWSAPAVPFGLYVLDGLLTRLDADGAQVPLQEVTRYLPVSYTAVNGSVFWSNGAEMGRVTFKGEPASWGIPVAPAPVLTPLTGLGGHEQGGDVLVALTLYDEHGIEGGASEPVRVKLAPREALEVHSSRYPCNVYAAKINDTTLRFTAQTNGPVILTY